MMHLICVFDACDDGSGCGVVVKLLTCGIRGPRFDPWSRHYDSEIEYLLLSTHDMTERLLKRGKILGTA